MDRPDMENIGGEFNTFGRPSASNSQNMYDYILYLEKQIKQMKCCGCCKFWMLHDIIEGQWVGCQCTDYEHHVEADRTKDIDDSCEHFEPRGE